jgi:Tfp pilus assembly protein PilW
VTATVVLMILFLAYQRRRYRDAEGAASREERGRNVMPEEP